MLSQLKTLQQQVELHDYAYYVLNNPSIPDAQYDAMLSKLQNLEAEYPEYADPNSPTSRVGSNITNKFRKANHTLPMRSIQSIYTIAELKNKIAPLTNVVIENKYDGLAIELEYINGNLHHALTRGNGTQGEDVSVNIRTIKSIPLKLKTPLTTIIRGEVVLPINQLQQVNKQRKKLKQQPYSTCRNAASSLVLAQKSDETASAKLVFIAYWLQGGSSHLQNMTLLRDQNFITTNRFPLCAFDSIEDAMDIAKCSTYPTDGFVFKTDSVKQQNQLNQTARNVRWAFALKTQTEALYTQLSYIRYNITSNGYITPIVQFKPITINNTSYKSSKISWQQLKQLTLHQCATLAVSIKGNVHAAIVNASNFKGLPIPELTLCPCCKQTLRTEQNTKQCINPNCPDKTGKYTIPANYSAYTPNATEANIHNLRFCAANYPVQVVRRSPGSNKAVLLYQSREQLFNIFKNLGFINA